MTADDELLVRLATYGLDHAPDLVPIDWSRVDLESVWTRLVSQRLTGLLTAALDDAVNAGEIDDEAVGPIEARLVARAVTLSALEWSLVDVTECLRANGIESAAVKGPALGRWLYPHHWWRDFGDLDVLVPADQLAAAVAALERADLRPIHRPATPQAASLLGKGVTLQATPGFELDVHHTLVSGSLGFGLAWNWWMDSGRTIDIGGAAISTTGTIRTAVHLLAHLSIGGPFGSLHVARDVAEILNLIDPYSAAGDTLSSAVAAAGLDGLVQQGVTRTRVALGWQHDAWIDWARHHPADSAWSRIERCFEREQASFGAVVEASLRAHRRPIERARILRAVAWPDGGHLADRGLTRWRYLTRAARVIVRTD